MQTALVLTGVWVVSIVVLMVYVTKLRREAMSGQNQTC